MSDDIIDFNKYKTRGKVTIDWNVMSDFGLIARINKEILGPIGLEIIKNVDGSSTEIIVTKDPWQYNSLLELCIMPDHEIQEKLKGLFKDE